MRRYIKEIFFLIALLLVPCNDLKLNGAVCVGGVINILTKLQFQVMLKSEEEFMKLWLY